MSISPLCGQDFDEVGRIVGVLRSLTKKTGMD